MPAFMLLNVHSYYSLRYGTLSIDALTDLLLQTGYDTAVLTDINNSTGVLEFIRVCTEKGLKGLGGIEFRSGNELSYIGIAKNNLGFRELNDLLTNCNLQNKPIPETPPCFENAFVIYPFGKKETGDLRAFEFIGVRPGQVNKLVLNTPGRSRYVIWQPLTFADKNDFRLHCQLRAVDNNILLSQLKQAQAATRDEVPLRPAALLDAYKRVPEVILNTRRLLEQCSFKFDFTAVKNKKAFTGNPYDDKLLLEKLALDGWKQRYGIHNREAYDRIIKELQIIDDLRFSAYFLIAWDIVRYSISRGFYHVGRGSGANSVVAYCLKITDVCPLELDLYFERFLNPKRKAPPDFDIDYCWKDRDEVFDYIFKRYGDQYTALLGTMSTFRDRSIIRELGKVYGLPKQEIDQLIKEPNAAQNKHRISRLILATYDRLVDFPNLRSIHAGGVLISELPMTSYTALDLPPKGFPTVQFDMYQAEDIGLEKLDILSQRGIGHIKEAADIIYRNRKIKVDVHDIEAFKKDSKVREQLKSGDTIGCFYIESPAMRGLLKKLRCEDYLTLVAASSIIRPGVAKSGMMRQYIYRFHHPNDFQYLHPVMKEQLKETYGVMVYQEDVLKIGHYFGGLDLADADVLRRLMSGKNRGLHHLVEIRDKFFQHCKKQGYPQQTTDEVWRQIESFAGYSFSKAHSASYAVESYQSLYLKTHYPLEFMTAVINNFGGFYNTRVYVNEARKAGATIHLPCVNNSGYATTIRGADIYLGFIHIQSLEQYYAEKIPSERKKGAFTGLENFIERMGIGLEQAELLIRTGALRFTGKNKKTLLWEALSLLNKGSRQETGALLFTRDTKQFSLPAF
ncbi:MAG TPA: DNA polymerase III subunit alpha, partial [Chitinophagaceae bacterium]|nr:DNA polymerase III subunit alpha [Chitinophagaceae bacterium]